MPDTLTLPPPPSGFSELPPAPSGFSDLPPPPAGFREYTPDPYQTGSVGNLKKWLGVPYKWGGQTCEGADCSGFTMAAMGERGIKLPRTAREQFKAGQPVPLRDPYSGAASTANLQDGDMVFFDRTQKSLKPGEASHVGIYTLDENGVPHIVHASSGSKKVVSVPFSKFEQSSLWRNKLLGARRFDSQPSPAQAPAATQAGAVSRAAPVPAATPSNRTPEVERALAQYRYDYLGPNSQSEPALLAEALADNILKKRPAHIVKANQEQFNRMSGVGQIAIKERVDKLVRMAKGETFMTGLPKPPEPSTLQQAQDVLATPSGYVKAGIFKAGEAIRPHLGAGPLSRDGRLPEDIEEAKRLGKLSVPELASELKHQPIKNLGQPQAQFNEQKRLAEAGILARGAAAVAELAVGTAIDPVTWAMGATNALTGSAVRAADTARKAGNVRKAASLDKLAKAFQAGDIAANTAFTLQDSLSLSQLDATNDPIGFLFNAGLITLGGVGVGHAASAPQVHSALARSLETGQALPASLAKRADKLGLPKDPQLRAAYMLGGKPQGGGLHFDKDSGSTYVPFEIDGKDVNVAVSGAIARDIETARAAVTARPQRPKKGGKQSASTIQSTTTVDAYPSRQEGVGQTGSGGIRPGDEGQVRQSAGTRPEEGQGNSEAQVAPQVARGAAELQATLEAHPNYSKPQAQARVRVVDTLLRRLSKETGRPLDDLYSTFLTKNVDDVEAFISEYRAEVKKPIGTPAERKAREAKLTAITEEAVKPDEASEPVRVTGVHDELVRQFPNAQTRPDTPEGKAEWLRSQGHVSGETGQRLRYVYTLSDGRTVSTEGVIRVTNPELWEKIKDNRQWSRSAKGREAVFNALPEDAQKGLIDLIPADDIAQNKKPSEDNVTALSRWLKSNGHILADTGSSKLAPVLNRMGAVSEALASINPTPDQVRAGLSRSGGNRQALMVHADGRTALGNAEGVGGRTEALAGMGFKPEQKSGDVPAATDRTQTTVQPTTPPASSGIGTMRVADIARDPDRFQYKVSTGAKGQSGELTGIPYNPALQGVLSVWKDPKDGKTYVVNGHNRLGLAEENGVADVPIVYINASDESTARFVGALQNIAEGRGTAIDAAKLFRERQLTPADLRAEGVSMRGKMAADGLALSQLPEGLWRAVYRGEIPVSRGVAFGGSGLNQGQQIALYQIIQKKGKAGERLTDPEITELAKFVSNAGETTRTENTLFGEEHIRQSNAIEKAKLTAWLKGELSRDQRIFKPLANEARAKAAAEVGNVLKTDENRQIAENAERIKELFDKHAYRSGPIAEALNDAAGKLAAGDNEHGIKSLLKERVRQAVEDILTGPRSSKTSEPSNSEQPRGPARVQEATEVDSDTGALFQQSDHKESRVDRLPQSEMPPAPLEYRIIEPDGSSEVKRTTNEMEAEGYRKHGYRVVPVDSPAVPSKSSQPDGPAVLLQRGEKASTFYSKAERVVTEKMGNRAPSEGVSAMLLKNGVKPEEMKWSGLDELLKSKQVVTKDDILRHLAENNVQVEEVVKGTTAGHEFTPDEDDPNIIIVSAANDRHGSAIGEITKRGASSFESMDDSGNTATFKSLDEAKKWFERNRPVPETKFGTYTTPGGKNYRELLLTLPVKGGESAKTARLKELRDHVRALEMDEENSLPSERPEFERQIRNTYTQIEMVERGDMGDRSAYRGSHWDEPNVLAHIRFDDRAGPNSEKILHVAEIQSDWHQAGRKKGYVNAEKPWEVFDPKDGRAIGNYATEAEAKAVAESNRAWDYENQSRSTDLNFQRVPDAPFKKTWHELSLKRILRYAAENGYDGVSWDPGSVHADRYDLSKQVDSVTVWSDGRGKYHWEAKKDGRGLNADREGSITADKLADVIGKELTERAVADISAGRDAEYAGLDLKVGGEGMNGFYDKIVPDTLNALGKRFGAKVGETRLMKMSPEGKFRPVDEWSNTFRDFDTVAEADAWAGKVQRGKSGETVPYMPISESMRESAVSEGFPLFQKEGAPQSDAKGKPLAAYFPATEEHAQAVIALGSNANFSSSGHEFFHHVHALMEQYAPESEAIRTDLDAMAKWAGAKEGKDGTWVWSEKNREDLARAWERYEREGNAPTSELQSTFDRIKEWMVAIYRKIEGSSLKKQLTDDLRQTFDRMLGAEEAKTTGRVEPVRPKVEAASPRVPKRPIASVEKATGLANQVQEREALARIINEVEPASGKGKEHWQKVGKEAVENHDRPDADYETLAYRVEAGEAELTGERVGILLEGKRLLENAMLVKQEALDADKGNKDKIAAYQEARARLDDYLAAVQAGKGRWSDVGRALQAGVELDTGNFAQVIAERNRMGSRVSDTTLKALTDKVAEKDARIAALESREATLAADRAVQRLSRERRTAQSVEDIQKRRKSLIAQLKGEEALKQEAEPPSQLFQREEVDPTKARAIYELARTYVEEGVVKFSDVVGRIAEDLDWKREDVINALAAKMSKEQPAIEIQKQMRDLKTLAAAEARLAEAEKGVFPGKKPKPVVSAQLKALRSRYSELKSLSEVNSKIEDLKQQLLSGEFKRPDEREKTVTARLENLRAERDFYSAKVRHAIREPEPRLMVGARVASGIMRGLRLGSDIGIMLRQGMVVAGELPIDVSKAIYRQLRGLEKTDIKMYRSTVEALKNMTSDRAMIKYEHHAAEKRGADGVLYVVKEKKAGLQTTDRLYNVEENVLGVALSRIPVVGPLLDRFQHVWINEARRSMFRSAVDAGFNEAELHEYARYINTALGRSNAKQIPAALELVMTSPRYERSRWEFIGQIVQSPATAIRATKNRAARAKVVSLAATAATAYLVFKAAEQQGYEVDWDYDSSEFLKMRRGNEVWDISAGIAPRIRDVIRLFLWSKNPSNKENLGRIIKEAASRPLSPFVKTPIEQASSATQRRQGVKEEEIKSAFTGYPLDPDEKGWWAFTPLIVNTFHNTLYGDKDSGSAFSAAGKEFIGTSLNRYPKKPAKEPKQSSDLFAPSGSGKSSNPFAGSMFR